jgi:phage tail-like protein
MAGDDELRSQSNAAFRFVVDVDGERLAAFTECSLPSLEWEIEELKEGGLNTYIHQLPGRLKAAKVSLKNGIGKSSLLDWYIEAIGKTVSRKSITITLLDASRKSLMVWNIKDAYPIKWAGPQLNTTQNAIAIQTLDLACGETSVSMEG